MGNLNSFCIFGPGCSLLINSFQTLWAGQGVALRALSFVFQISEHKHRKQHFIPDECSRKSDGATVKLLSMYPDASPILSIREADFVKWFTTCHKHVRKMSIHSFIQSVSQSVSRSVSVSQSVIHSFIHSFRWFLHALSLHFDLFQ